MWIGRMGWKVAESMAIKACASIGLDSGACWIRMLSRLSFRTDETGTTTVTVHQVVRGLDGSILVDQMVEHAYLIEDGLIRKMDIG